MHRPEVRNAFHIGMIRELIACFGELESESRITLVRLTSSGPHFSSGADLNWMREGQKQGKEQLRNESLELYDLFRTIRSSRMIVVASVRGRAMGGALGLLAASDIVVAEDSSSFAFSEVKLGLAPSIIAPFVAGKIGYSRSNELMLTGRTFIAESALEYGLVHYICREGSLEEETEKVLDQIRSNGPRAMSAVKFLLQQLQSDADPARVREFTAELIARLRTSEEGQEGMSAFLEKRDPLWHAES